MILSDMCIEETLCFTGHRPDQLGGYDPLDAWNASICNKMETLIMDCIEKHGVKNFISGMALGVDQWAAEIVLKLKSKYPHIKLVAAVPCKRQWKTWSDPKAIVKWRELVDSADLVHYVSNDEYTPKCMFVRNMWMADHSKYVLAVYNGAQKGGTYNCVKYAKKQNKHLIQLNPLDVKVA